MRKYTIVLLTAILLIAEVGVADTGNSNTVTLIGNAVTGPNSGTVMTGQEAQFVVNLVGNGPFSYLWRKNGSSIGAPNSSIYTIASAVLSDAGDYDCVATSAGGMDIPSSTATLTVLQTLMVTQQPLNMTRNEGQGATFTVTVLSNGTPAYQWQKYNTGTSSWDNVGTNSNSFQITNLALADAGDYQCVITDATPLTVTTNTTKLAVLKAGVSPELKITFDAGTPGQLSNGTFNLQGADFLSLFQNQAGVTAAAGSPATVTAIVIRLTAPSVSVVGTPVFIAGIPAPIGDSTAETFTNANIGTTYNALALIGFRFSGAIPPTTNYYLSNTSVKVTLTYGGTGELAASSNGWILNLTTPLP